MHWNKVIVGVAMVAIVAAGATEAEPAGSGSLAGSTSGHSGSRGRDDR